MSSSEIVISHQVISGSFDALSPFTHTLIVVVEIFTKVQFVENETFVSCVSSCSVQLKKINLFKAKRPVEI